MLGGAAVAPAKLGSDGQGWIIRPEPTDDELVALVTALTVALASPAAAPGPARSDLEGRWARAGRTAALTAWPPAVAVAWGRRRP